MNAKQAMDNLAMASWQLAEAETLDVMSDRLRKRAKALRIAAAKNISLTHLDISESLDKYKRKP